MRKDGRLLSDIVSFRLLPITSIGMMFRRKAILDELAQKVGQGVIKSGRRGQLYKISVTFRVIYVIGQVLRRKNANCQVFVVFCMEFIILFPRYVDPY